MYTVQGLYVIWQLSLVTFRWVALLTELYCKEEPAC